ncbi:PREDICTED: uncharacterized protein LOC101304008 [Fragaria vesca subsp. vesca]
MEAVPRNLVSIIVSWWEMFEGENKKSIGVQRRDSGLRERGSASWSKPSVGVVKLNIDGALDVKRGIYGIGAVHHDENGICLGVLVVSGTGLLSLHVVEALALVHGLHFCAQIGFTHLEVEGDTLNVFAGLDEAIDDFSEVGAIMDEARS